MCSTARLDLHFTSQRTPELTRTVFYPPHENEPIVGFRGYTAPPRGFPFKWAPSCHALSILYVKARRRALTPDSFDMPLLSGTRSTPASSIGILLTKRSFAWLQDLFGVDASGRSLLKKILIPVNARMKTPGPVEIYLRTAFLPPINISVYQEGVNISEDKTRLGKLLELLERTWTPGQNIYTRHGGKEELVA